MGSNDPSSSGLKLGSGTNTLEANTINIGWGKTGGIVQFLNSSGTATITGTGGGSATADITLGNANGGTYGTGRLSQLLLAGHTANVQARTVIVGEHTGAGGGGANSTITFDTGTFNATESSIGSQFKRHHFGRRHRRVHSRYRHNSTSVLNVAGSFYLADNTNPTAAPVPASNGTFTMNGGTANLFCNISVPSTQGTSTTTLALNGGVLDMHGHAIGGNGTGGTGAAITNVTLGQVTIANLGGGGINNAGLTTSGNTLTLAGTNTYTGGTTLNGTLQVGSATLTGSLPAGGSVNLNGQTLNFASFARLATVACLPEGARSNKSALSTTTISGNSPAFTGSVNVQSGGFAVNGSLPSASPLNVSGGTLSGTGTIVGGISVNSSGTVAPGTLANPQGTLTSTGQLGYSGGSLTFAVGSTGSSSISVASAEFGSTTQTFLSAYRASPRRMDLSRSSVPQAHLPAIAVWRASARPRLVARRSRLRNKAETKSWSISPAVRQR